MFGHVESMKKNCQKIRLVHTRDFPNHHRGFLQSLYACVGGSSTMIIVTSSCKFPEQASKTLSMMILGARDASICFDILDINLGQSKSQTPSEAMVILAPASGITICRKYVHSKC